MIDSKIIQAELQTETRLVFMGTPEFAAPVLQRLVSEGAHSGWRVVAVVTQPDRPAGRGNRLTVSAVKEVALQHKLPILQPATLRKDPESVNALRALAPDLLIVAAYGLILPKSVLEIPTSGCINVHASLLPAYRGASPIAAALLDGRAETGISVMVMDEGMDTGPVLAQSRLMIDSSDTTLSLSRRLAELGAQLLVETLPAWLRGEVAPTPQDALPGAVSICRLIEKSAGFIDWGQPASHLERMTRAYTPWPGAYTLWRGEPLRIWSAAVADGVALPGQVVRWRGEIAVGTGAGLLLLRNVQPAGKKNMDASSFVNGAPEFIGAVLPGPNAATA